MVDLLHVAYAHMLVTHAAGVVVRAVVSTVEAGRSQLAVVSGQLDSRNGFDYVGLVVKESNVRADWRREMGEELRRWCNSRRSSSCRRRWRNWKKPFFQVFGSARYRMFALEAGYTPYGGSQA